MNVVYDISEYPEISNFVYDVKILYQLTGERVDSFSELCARTFDETSLLPYRKAVKTIHSHIQSYLECKIDTNKYKLDDLVPAHALMSFHDERNGLTQKLFKRFHNEKVIEFYETLFPRVRTLHEIAKHLDLKFNYVGTKTGRLSFKKNTFNPYTLAKEKRSCIKARDGYYLCQYDIKASQPRIAIFSANDSALRQRFSDAYDIYSVFGADRDRHKIGLLRWMFGSAPDATYDAIAKPIRRLRENIAHDVERYGYVTNRFHRPLYFSTEPNHTIFQNYISSTEADALYEIVERIHAHLKPTSSRILFPFYDAIIVEINKDEAHLESEIQALVETHFVDHVFFTKFPVEVTKGEDYGHMH